MISEQIRTIICFRNLPDRKNVSLIMKKIVPVFLILAALRCSAQNNDLDKTYTKVKIEIDATFPGGDSAFSKFLSHNLKYPDDAINNEIHGTVIVQFVVDTAGNISDIKAISGPKKGGLREESVRVITLSGKWIPATQNGQKVQSYKTEPIQFKMSFN
jgi:TonB family protein